MPIDVELYRRNVHAPMVPPHKHSRRISVIDILPEDATRTFVFVHGYGGSAMQWLPQLRYFGQFTHVVAPELRGHGLSDDPRELAASMDGLVEDLALTLVQLQITPPFSLIAHSFGGAIATEYTLRYPANVSELVLIGVPPHFVIHPWIRRLMNVPPQLFNTIVRRLNIALYAKLHTLKRLYDDAMAPWSGKERLPQLQVPTLVILGERDRVFRRDAYEDTTRLIPGAQQTVIPVSAHLVQLERAEAVNRAISRFTAGHITNGKVAPMGPQRIANLWTQSYDNDVPDQVPVPRQPLQDLLSNAAREFPNHPAILFFGQRIRYHELDRLTNRFAHALQKHQIQPGDRVAIILPNIPQCIIAFYGTLKAGAVVVLGSPLTKEAEIADQLRDSGAKILLTLTTYRSSIGRMCANTDIKEVIYTDVREYLPLRQRLRLAQNLDGVAPAASNAGQDSRRTNIPSFNFQRLLAGQPATPLSFVQADDDLALLQYTSGTVDPPKGAMLTHRNLMANVAQVRNWMPDARRGREVTLCPLPLTHSYGVTNGMNLVVALAGSVIPMPTTRIDVMLQAVKRYRPSLMPGVPAIYIAIANFPNVRRYGMASIRICISGSAPMPVEVQEDFEKLTRGRLVEGYGLTEASPVTHCNPLKGERRVGSIGIPLPSTLARIVDSETDEELPIGDVGELVIQGPQVMRGYWQRPADTARALKDGWLHTGDLARMDEDGFFTIVERKKDVILFGPYNVYPREVEEVLYEHPKVLEAAVVGTTEGGHSPIIKAVVVLKHGERATQEELLALCRERLDAYKVPRIIEFRNELPKNFVGKILRRLLVDA